MSRRFSKPESSEAEEASKRRRIKLVVSDFHVGTGRYGPHGKRNALEDFYFDEKFVEFLEFHRTGEFHDAEVELIINGDFFNLLQLNEVAHQEDFFTEQVCIELMRRVFAGHAQLFDALARFAAAERRSLTFIMGNHDPGFLFDGVQDLLKERLGEAARFYLEHYRFDEVHIEHGHRWDPLNAYDPRRLFLTRGLPEPVVNLPWGAHYLIHVMSKEKEKRPYLDKVTPHKRFIRWALFNDTAWLIRVTFRSFLFLFQSTLTKAPHRSFGLLDLWRRILRYHPSPILEREAIEVMDRSAAKTVILGHTHIALFREYEGDRSYLNTGTWNHVTSLEIEHLGRLVKLSYGFLEFDPGRSRWTPHLREWKGYQRVAEEIYR